MDKKNKPIIFGMLTIILSQLLMNLGRLTDVVPDSVIRIVGVAVLILTGVTVFFAVRSVVELKQTERESENKEQE